MIFAKWDCRHKAGSSAKGCPSGDRCPDKDLRRFGHSGQNWLPLCTFPILQTTCTSLGQNFGGMDIQGDKTMLFGNRPTKIDRFFYDERCKVVLVL